MNHNTLPDGIVSWKGTREMPWDRSFKMNVFLYIMDGLLIDTGPYLLAQESAAFFNANIIEQVALTHIHEDHAGMAAWLQNTYDVPVYIHPESVAEAAVEPQFVKYRLEFWGRRPAFKAETVPEQIETDRYKFQVIDTPGHCKYHKAFLELQHGWLFSGDLLVNIKPRSVYCEENMSEMIESLQKISALDFDTVFCSHTGILNNGKQVCLQKLDYLLNLQEKVINLRKEGKEDQQICNMLFPEKNPVKVFPEGDFSSYFVVSTL